MSDRLVDAQGVADRLGVPVSWVRDQTRSGAIPHLRLGRYVRFDLEDVDEWLQTQRVGQWRKYQPGRAL